jgi:hypothetical protein
MSHNNSKISNVNNTSDRVNNNRYENSIGINNTEKRSGGMEDFGRKNLFLKFSS